ncbi:hypothetical protein PYCC9005_000732 [Savitreella phatthalungensis]
MQVALLVSGLLAGSTAQVPSPSAVASDGPSAPSTDPLTISQACPRLSTSSITSTSSTPGYETSGPAPFYAPSPPFYPSPRGTGEGVTLDGAWTIAYQQAAAYVATLDTLQKVNLTTGIGWNNGKCLGQTGLAGPNFTGYCLMDSPLGIRATDGNTVFPPLSQVAKSWDRTLIRAHGRAMGEEFRSKGAHVQLGPVVGPLGTFPLGGRGWEGYSPDSYLAGQGVSETILGQQAAGLQSCVKHYIGNEQEHFRQASETYGPQPKFNESIDAYVSDRAMHETYLWPFADAVRAGVSSVMCSYQQINGSYGCANSKTLNGLLKDELGFQGYVMSDWAATHAGVAAVLAGLDMTMPGDQSFRSGDSYFGSNLTAAVINGTISEERLNDMAIRILAPYYRLKQNINYPKTSFSAWTLDTVGSLYPDGPPVVVNEHVDVRSTHGTIAYRSALESIILLKNTVNSLPLGYTRRLTIFGQTSVVNPLGANGCPDRGCDDGILGSGWGSGTSNYPYQIGADSALQRYALSQGSLFYDVSNTYDADAIAQAASSATKSVVFISADSGEGYISVDGNYGDRKNYTAWHDGDRLVRNVTSKCNDTVVVVYSVGAISLEQWVDNPNVTAVVWAGLGGQEAGQALADVLYGGYNPSGKLTFTIGRNLSDYGPGILYRPQNARPAQNLSHWIDYKHFDLNNITPRYAFGYGLSYTTFAIANCTTQMVSNASYSPRSAYPTGTPPSIPPANLSASQALAPSGQPIISQWIYPYLNSTQQAQPRESYPYPYQGTPSLPLSPAGGGPGGNPSLYDVLFETTCSVTNTGARSGAEVVQLYLGFPNSTTLSSAPYHLRGFEKVFLAPGTSAQVKFGTTRRDLSAWDPAVQNWVFLSGQYTFNVGNSSRSFSHVRTVELT